MATHKTLQVTFWTRLRDLVKGMLLYGTINWERASDGLKPPRLTPRERRIAMPARNPEVIKPRENPQAALVKMLPKKMTYPKGWDITAGAIVSDPSLPDEPPVSPKRFHAAPPSGHEAVEPLAEEQTPPERNEAVVVRRRRRHHRHGMMARRIPRSSFQFGESGKPGLLARWFKSK